MKRDGTRMKFIPGSQNTRGHKPPGEPIASQMLTSVNRA
jgi:hypothetical protein